jgi:hypothetical protein
MESLYDAAGLIRSVPDTNAHGGVAVVIRSLVHSGDYQLFTRRAE